MRRNRLGIFIRSPVGDVKTRLSPPLTPEDARDLYAAWCRDLFARVEASKFRPTVFLAGEHPGERIGWLPRQWPVVAQHGVDLGARLEAAFAHLLDAPGTCAVVIGSDSPDLPLPYLRRAFRKLKHRDVVVGPATDGGYYLVGLRTPAPRIFAGIRWGSSTVFEETLDAVAREGLTLALLPPWYDIDDGASLRFFATMCRARKLAGDRGWSHTERSLATRGADVLPGRK
jgi:rSAM/selenodomain-associated transferase 1